MVPTVVDPPFGSVENLAAMIRRFPGDRKAYLLGLIDSIISDLYGSDTRKVGFIRNALVAGHLVDKEPVDPTGQLYSREADDPTPVSGARFEPHVGGMTESGLVDETPVEPVHMDFTSGESMCGLAATTPHKRSLGWRHVTCKACISQADES